MKKETVKQAGKFGVVGISNTLLDLGVFNILTEVFKIFPVYSNIVSVSLAIINSYIWNKNWTFKDKSKDDIPVEFTKFVSFSLVGMTIQTSMIWLLAVRFTGSGLFMFNIVQLLGLDVIFSESFVVNNWAKVWGIGLALIWNFFAYKKWTFNTKK